MMALLFSTFVMVTPCRIVDTRVDTAINLAIPSNGMIAFIAKGDATREGIKGGGMSPVSYGFADQGGKFNGCDIPESARAIAATLTALPTQSSGGHLVAWKYEIDYYTSWGRIPILKPAPPVATLTWSDGKNVSTAFAIFKVCVIEEAQFNDCSEDFVVTAKGSPAHLVVDVVGYWE